MQEWHIAALLGVLTAVGGGLRWFFGWLDGRARIRHERALELEDKRLENAKEIEADKAALALRIEKMQENFLNAEQALLQRLDDEREARLKQALQHATALSDTTQRILEAAEQMRLSSRSPTTGTKS